MTTMLQLWRSQTGIRKLLLGGSGLILLGALFMLALVGLPQQVEVQVDGETLHISTWQKTVAGALEEARVTLGEADVVEPALDQQLAGAQVIRVVRAFPVRIMDGEDLVEVVTVAKPVAEILALAEITLNEDDIINQAIEQQIAKTNNYIKITRVSYQTEVKEVKVPFATEITDNPNAIEGVRQTVQAGKDGLTREEYQITYHNGEEVARELIHQEEIQQPVPRIVAQGTQPRVMVAARGGHNIQYRQALSMEATAYTHTGNPTFTGIMPHVGIVAVDPNVIPLGTELYVDGYGFAKAADIGTSIRGNKIDLFMDSRAEALKFGRRTVKVYILE